MHTYPDGQSIPARGLAPPVADADVDRGSRARAATVDAVAAALNSHPHKTLGWETPAERLHELLTA
ncbi:hypothetical protein GCM10014715_83520 [Streptomyces spiralis]|uniref:Uncharacterized protein n=1 Tax=Streptomyces spiralis TaxID=66376 RepID=A0A919AM62_9ACTN|nr:hypothetical protein GCM10014715_83520 [Streptomyces spiralis]